jgi:hypothetical protein
MATIAPSTSRLADAFSAGSSNPPVLVAGHCAPGHEADLSRSIERMRDAGTEVKVSLDSLSRDDDAWRALSSATRDTGPASAGTPRRWVVTLARG